MENKIPTAEEFIQELQTEQGEQEYTLLYKIDVPKKMIEFAKLHVEAALSNVDRLASLKCNNGKGFRDFIDEDSILNAYSLTNIK
jgi:hypothetical protein